MNFDVDAMSDVYRVEMGNIREYTYPDVNLGEDIDKHFSYPTNEVASETNASHEDYNDDIDFNEDLDDVLNQDESDSDRNNAGTSHDSVRCVNGLSYQQEVLECNRQQSNTMQKYNIEDTLVSVEDESEDFEHPILSPQVRRQAGRPKKKRIGTKDRDDNKLHAETVEKLGITVSLAKILHSEIEVI
ncbi:hypothetical protein MRB53_006588 [Persea americana]|uniref:Uncharacterized protein n=1 Tax=Persea americana TaxID=3435 RepID=A0ACC2MHD5_PERAE|nr:hypothetical protein MRB53_006588 [Persea americana]